MTGNGETRTPPADHSWEGDEDGHNCAVCVERNDTLRMCWRENHLCADGHPMRAVTLDGHGGINCTICGSTGREADATVHPGGEACRLTGCHQDRGAGASTRKGEDALPPSDAIGPGSSLTPDAEQEVVTRFADPAPPIPLRAFGPNDEAHAHKHEWDAEGRCRFCPVEKPAMDALAALIRAIEGQEKAVDAVMLGGGSKGLKAAADFELTYRRLTGG